MLSAVFMAQSYIKLTLIIALDKVYYCYVTLLLHNVVHRDRCLKNFRRPREFQSPYASHKMQQLIKLQDKFLAPKSTSILALSLETKSAYKLLCRSSSAQLTRTLNLRGPNEDGTHA